VKRFIYIMLILFLINSCKENKSNDFIKMSEIERCKQSCENPPSYTFLKLRDFATARKKCFKECEQDDIERQRVSMLTPRERECEYLSLKSDIHYQDLKDCERKCKAAGKIACSHCIRFMDDSEDILSPENKDCFEKKEMKVPILKRIK
jgi:hypothetical protein